MTLIRNELIKLMRRKKTLITLIGFIALIALIAFGLNSQSNSYKRSQSPESQKSMLQNQIDLQNSMRNDPNISSDKKASIEDTIKQLEDQIETLNSGKVVDWKVQLQAEIDSIKAQQSDSNIPANQKDGIKNQLTLDQYLLDNNIKPVNGPELNGSTYLINLFAILGTIFLAIGVAIFSSDIVSGEYSPATAKFLLTQPVSRAKVLLSKFLTAVLSSVFLICIVEIIAFVIVGCMTGFGNMNYPQLVGTRYQLDMAHLNSMGGHDMVAIAGSSYIISTGEFLIKAFLLQILFVVACTSFVFMLSTIFKNSMIVMSTSIVAIIAIIILEQFAALKKVASFIFLIYGDVSSVFNGGVALSLQTPYATTGFVIIIMLVWTVVCYVISHIVFVKRDLLI